MENIIIFCIIAATVVYVARLYKAKHEEKIEEMPEEETPVEAKRKSKKSNKK